MQKEFNKIKPYVYWIKNNITGIKYIGVRWKNVRLKRTPAQDFGKTYFSSGKIKKDFKKNPDNFRIKFISTFDTVEEAIAFEKKRTKKVYKNKRYANVSSYPAIINKIHPMKGKKQSDEMRRKLSEANKGKKLNKETRRKISEALKKNHPMKGKTQTPEARIKISKAHKGKKLSELTKRKISLSTKGKKLSEDTKQKISKTRTGIQLSKETKMKISISKKGKVGTWIGRKHTEESKRKRIFFKKF